MKKKRASASSPIKGLRTRCVSSTASTTSSGKQLDLLSHCPQPEARDAGAVRRSASVSGRASAAVGIAKPRGGSAAVDEPPYTPAAFATAWETVPYDPVAHRVPDHPPSHTPIKGCDCVACTGRPRLNRPVLP